MEIRVNTAGLLAIVAFSYSLWFMTLTISCLRLTTSLDGIGKCVYTLGGVAQSGVSFTGTASMETINFLGNTILQFVSTTGNCIAGCLPTIESIMASSSYFLREETRALLSLIGDVLSNTLTFTGNGILAALNLCGKGVWHSVLLFTHIIQTITTFGALALILELAIIYGLYFHLDYSKSLLYDIEAAMKIPINNIWEQTKILTKNMTNYVTVISVLRFCIFMIALKIFSYIIIQLAHIFWYSSL